MRIQVVRPYLASSMLLGLCCTPALAAHVIVVSSRGSVTITQGDQLMTVSASAHIALPAQIKTGADGMLDLKDTDSLVHIGPNSTVALPNSDNSGNLVDRYLQSAGSALYNIQSRHGRPLSVETPYLVSVVKGTVFTISVEKGASSVTLMEGSLDVSAPGGRQHVLLKPNQSIRRSDGDTSLVVIPAGTAPATLKSAGADAQTQAIDQVNADQAAFVTRDLAAVGAAVSAQHALSAASTPPVSAMTSAAAAGNTSRLTTTSSSGPSGNPVAAASSGGTNTPLPNPTAGSGAGAGSSQSPTSAGTSTGTTSMAPGAPTVASPSTSTTTPTPLATSAATGSGATGTSGTSGTTETAPGATTTGAAAATTGGTATGGTAGPPPATPAAGSTGSSSTTPVVGCNGKTNGTGEGQCLGHKHKT